MSAGIRPSPAVKAWEEGEGQATGQTSFYQERGPGVVAPREDPSLAKLKRQVLSALFSYFLGFSCHGA